MDMTSYRRRLLSVLASLAALSSLLVGVPWSRAATDPSLQVKREVTEVLGGTPVTLTPRLSREVSSPRQINFSVESGPATSDQTFCTVVAQTDSCQVVFNSSQQGTSLVRFSIDGEDVDLTEDRLANRDLSLLPSADCRPQDEDLIVIGGGNCRPPGVTPDAGSESEPDDTDVVQITWTSFVDGRLDCDDSNPSNGEDVEYNPSTIRDEQYTCVLTSLGNPPLPIAGAKIDAERLGGLGDSDSDAAPDADGTV
ncbi:MAG: hypothetical protein ACRDZ3_04775, partial [Acidimicrobiia bacterium]